jgi:hypothetical protein
MVTTNEIEMVKTAQWLRHKPDRLFHAYRHGRSGAESLCGQTSPIHDIREMDIPGARSGCCGQCFIALYGIDTKEPKYKDAP